MLLNYWNLNKKLFTQKLQSCLNQKHSMKNQVSDTGSGESLVLSMNEQMGIKTTDCQR